MHEKVFSNDLKGVGSPHFFEGKPQDPHLFFHSHQQLPLTKIFLHTTMCVYESCNSIDALELDDLKWKMG